MDGSVSVSLAPQVPPSLQPLISPPSYQQGIDNKISPSILLIIIILAVIFFLSGLLHLLIKFLLKPSQGDPGDFDSVTALQGQLQQLFHLHDAGVDQSFIDTLPVFIYKAIIGLKSPFDCAVCLCEFEEEDKLRFLPKCSHAFHLECIDTWLLSHSTCPLCRGSLLPDFSANCSPVVFVLESGSESSREIVTDRGAVAGASVSGTQMGFHGEDEFGSSRTDVSQKQVEIEVGLAKEDMISEPKLFPVKLGKFRNVDFVGAGAESSNGTSNGDARRCLSMGSLEYVLDDSSVLHVAIAPPLRNQGSKNRKPTLPSTPGHRSAMSECDLSKDSSSCKHGFKGFETTIREINGYGVAASIQKVKTESFSISKIWLRSKKSEKSGESSRRAFSFRLPLHQGGAGDDLKMKQSSSRMSVSETEIAAWDSYSNICSYPRSEFGIEEEEEGDFNFNSIESHSKTPSFARRTLNRLLGRQNKVVNLSPTDPV